MAIKYLMFVVFFSALVSSIEDNQRPNDQGADLDDDYDGSWIEWPTSPPSPAPVDASDVCDFEKWRRLVNCSQRNLTAVPRNIPPDTEILYLGINLLFRLRNESFANLTELRELHVDSSELTNVESSAFDGLGNLEILDLHGNSLSYLPDELFVKNTKLTELNLGNNRFNEIPCKTLLPLRRLSKLLLFLNDISLPYCERFPNLTNNAVVSLSRNNIRVMRHWTFQFLENSTISGLFLRGNRLALVDFRAIAYLKARELEMSFNPLTEIGIASLFYGVRVNDMLRRIELRGALLNSKDHTNFIFLKNKTLDYLDASANNFTGIPLWTKYLNRVRNFSLADNSIEHIDRMAFNEMTALEEVNLENNQILELETFTGNTHWNLTQLRTLRLAKNRLDNIPTNPFLGLDNLTSLDLHSNPITYLNIQALNGLNRLENLDLSETKVSSITDGTFQFVPNIKSLNFRNANLLLAVPRRFLIALKQLERIDLSGNNLQSLDLWNDYFQVSIFSKNTHLREIRMNDNSKLIDIPTRTFENLTSLSFLSLNNCGLKSIKANIFRDLGNLSSLAFDMNSVSELPPDLLWNLKHLETISAAGNSLTSLGSAIFKNTLSLKYITLPNNAITFISGDSMSHLSDLRTFDLHGNPLACTCALEPFSDWLKVTNASLIGKERTLCSPASFEDVVGKPVIDFEPAAYCGPNIALFVSVPMLVVAIVVCVGLSFHYRYWLRYQLFMLKLSLVGRRINDARNADEYEYQLNVMFAADDQQWVDDYLKPVIINHFPDKNIHADMVFGDDDLIPGMYFLDAVDYSVVNSYKTVLLLSNASIRDEWFTTKFRIALEHVNETQIEKVIIVFLEDIEDVDLPFLVRVFLSKNKPYLRWTEDGDGQKYFKEQLLKSLEVNVRCDNTMPV